MFVHSPNEQSSSRGSGQLDLRRQNTVQVLQRVWAEQMSRAELARRTGLSRSTVTAITSELIEMGWVVEGRVAASSGGRPPTLLKVRRDFRHLVGVELGASHAAVVLTDLMGQVLGGAERSLDVQGDPEGTQRAMLELVDEVLVDAGVRVDQLAGLGLGLPCPLPATDALDPNILPAWVGHRPAQRIGDYLGVPVYSENDANLGALAELWWGAGRGVGDFSYIKIATGVGAGHIIDGRVYRGSGGIAGEIGHTAIDSRGPKCRCGLNGCLEAMVGRETLEARLGRPLETILQDAERGDPQVLQAIADAGEYLGIAVANLLNLLNPARVILGGRLTRAGDALLTPAREAARGRALFTTVENSRLLFSELGDEAVALGAATLVLQAVLEDPFRFTTPPGSARQPMEA